MDADTFVYGRSNIALVYDVDNTLIRGNHTSLVLEARGIDVDAFWKRVRDAEQEGDEGSENGLTDISYITLFMHEVYHGRLAGLSIAEIRALGSRLEKVLYPGLPDFFTRIRNANPQCKISHNVASVGMKPLLEGSVLAQYADRMFGYTFFDNLTPGETIDGVKGSLSAVEKIHAIVQISRGNVPKGHGFQYPIPNMVYFGDGFTDIPAFHFVNRYGGTTICVYDPERPEAKERAEALRHDVDHVVPADYQNESSLFRILTETIHVNHSRGMNTGFHQMF